MIKSFKYKKGMGLVEILVAVFIFSVVLGALITINNFYLSNSSKNIKLTKATYLAEEGIEAVRIIRDNSWSNISSLSNSVDYYLSFNIASSTWEATTSPSSIDSYIRKFNLLEVERDINGKIYPIILDKGELTKESVMKTERGKRHYCNGWHKRWSSCSRRLYRENYYI